MKKLVPYIMFSGNCEEALNFYKNILGGEILNMGKYADTPDFATEENKNKIMHAEFSAGGVYFMAADDVKSSDTVKGNRISLSFDCETAEEQEKAFNGFSDGAEITMPLQDTFWGARFGMLTDKFGISWMFNFDKPQS